MSHGVIVAGTECFEESRWHDDTLEGLPYDDVLWGYHWGRVLVSWVGKL